MLGNPLRKLWQIQTRVPTNWIIRSAMAEQKKIVSY